MISKRFRPLWPLRRTLNYLGKDRRLRIRLELDVSGIGAWAGEILVLVLDDETLRECQARVAATHRLFQPPVMIGAVDPIPATLPPGALRALQKKR